MNATKRKFNALLQGLSTSRPTTPDTSSSSKAESSLLKRPRTAAAAVASSSSTMESPLLTTTSLLPGPQSLLRKSSHTESAVRQQAAAARYCPSDREQLLRRLATFQEITDWTPKPDRVGEVQWAKRGWVCQGKERVRCVLCHKELLVKLNRKEQNGKEVTVLVASEIGEFIVESSQNHQLLLTLLKQ